MVVFLHVVVALLGIACATLSFFSPSKKRLTLSYSLIAGTMVSGIYLVWLMPSKIIHVCVAGFIYTLMTGVLTVAARVRLINRQKGNVNL